MESEGEFCSQGFLFLSLICLDICANQRTALEWTSHEFSLLMGFLFGPSVHDGSTHLAHDSCSWSLLFHFFQYHFMYWVFYVFSFRVRAGPAPLCSLFSLVQGLRVPLEDDRHGNTWIFWTCTQQKLPQLSWLDPFPRLTSHATAVGEALSSYLYNSHLICCWGFWVLRKVLY